MKTLTILFVLFVLFAATGAQAAPCKDGFAKVPAYPGYYAQPYCVMKDEMRHPATGAYWNYSSVAQLTKVCSALSQNSEMPTNSVWEGIARMAAAIDSNWTGGCVKCGQLKTAITVPDGEGGSSTFEHFGDGHWEWVRANSAQIYAGQIYQLQPGGTQYTINGLTLDLEGHFGFASHCAADSQCGVLTNQAAGGVARGGDDSEPGMFGVAMNHDPNYAPGYSDFSARCAYPSIDDN